MQNKGKVCGVYDSHNLVLTRGVPQGGKNRRRGKNENDDDKRELVFREDGQEYAQVIKMLGNGRLEAMCFDGEKRLAHIRGKMRKKVCIVVVPIRMLSDDSPNQVWINQGDIILLSLREFQDGKADVIVKYTGDEARNCRSTLRVHREQVLTSRSKSIWRATRECQNQRDRCLWR